MVRIDGYEGERGKELKAGGFVAGRQVLAVPASEKARLKLHNLAEQIFIDTITNTTPSTWSAGPCTARSQPC